MSKWTSLYIVMASTAHAVPVVIVINDEEEKKIATNIDALLAIPHEYKKEARYICDDDNDFIQKKMRWKKPRWQR